MMDGQRISTQVMTRGGWIPIKIYLQLSKEAPRSVYKGLLEAEEHRCHQHEVCRTVLMAGQGGRPISNEVIDQGEKSRS